MPKVDPIPQQVSTHALRPSRHRALDPESIQRLAESIRTIGLLNPITVRRLDTDPDGAMFAVIAGDHRLAAALAAGLKCVPIRIVDLTGARAEIAAIDENLFRHNLTAVEETAAIARRKHLWDELHASDGAALDDSPDPLLPAAPEARAAPQRHAGGRGHKGFAAEIAAATGVAERTSRRLAKRAETLGEGVTKLAGTSLAERGELDALAATDPATRAKLMQRAIAGEKVSAKQPRRAKARTVAEPPPTPYVPRTPEDYVDDLMQALKACAAHLSIDAIAKYQITGRLGRAERELIRSLASEPAMADVQDTLFSSAGATSAPDTARRPNANIIAPNPGPDAPPLDDFTPDPEFYTLPDTAPPDLPPPDPKQIVNEDVPMELILQRFGLSKAQARAASAAATPGNAVTINFGPHPSYRVGPDRPAASPA